MVAKRSVKSSRHLARGANQEPRRAIGAFEHVQRRRHLAAAVRHDAHVPRQELREHIEIARARCRHERGHELCMLRIDLARTAPTSGVTRRLWDRAAWPYCAHVNACADGKLPRHAGSLRCNVVPTSLNEKSNTSCSRKAARSSGDSRSSANSSATDKSSASLCGRRAPALPCRELALAARDRHTARAVRALTSAYRDKSALSWSLETLSDQRLVAVGRMPAQAGLLYRVLGVSHRLKHAVCETEQAPPVRLESRGWIRRRACGAHGVRAAISAGAGTRP